MKEKLRKILKNQARLDGKPRQNIYVAVREIEKLIEPLKEQLNKQTHSAQFRRVELLTQENVKLKQQVDIYSHSSAKALWGERPSRMGFNEHVSIDNWQYHLQQMVLEPEPRKYLEKFLEKEKQ